MPEEPEQVLLQDRITTQHAILHTGALVPIHQQARDSHTQHRQRPYQQEGRDHQRPHLHRHHAQAPMTPTPHSGQLVDGTQPRGQSQHMHAHQRQVRPHAQRITIPSDQRRLQSPARAQRPHEEHLTQQGRHERHHQQPEREPIHPRHHHLTRPSQQRQQLVPLPTYGHRHHEQEEHHNPMRRDPPVLHPALLHPTHHPSPRSHQLQPDQQRQSEAVRRTHLPRPPLQHAHQLMPHHRTRPRRPARKGHHTSLCPVHTC